MQHPMPDAPSRRAVPRRHEVGTGAKRLPVIVSGAGKRRSGVICCHDQSRGGQTERDAGWVHPPVESIHTRGPNMLSGDTLSGNDWLSRC